MLINFLKETEDFLKEHHKKLNHIKFIRNAEGYIPVSDFVAAAANFNYDNGYGTIDVDPTLKIVGKFWWAERRTYDGKEWWEFCAKPKKPTVKAPDFMIRNRRHWSDYKGGE